MSFDAIKLQSVVPWLQFWPSREERAILGSRQLLLGDIVRRGNRVIEWFLHRTSKPKELGPGPPTASGYCDSGLEP